MTNNEDINELLAIIKNCGNIKDTNQAKLGKMANTLCNYKGHLQGAERSKRELTKQLHTCLEKFSDVSDIIGEREAVEIAGISSKLDDTNSWIRELKDLYEQQGALVKEINQEISEADREIKSAVRLLKRRITEKYGKLNDEKQNKTIKEGEDNE